MARRSQPRTSRGLKWYSSTSNGQHAPSRTLLESRMQFPLVIGQLVVWAVWALGKCPSASAVTRQAASGPVPSTVPFLSVQGRVGLVQHRPCTPASIFTLQEDEHHGHSRCHHRIRHLHPPRYVYSNSVGCPTCSLFPTHSIAECVL
jgi:hypothetical protein